MCVQVSLVQIRTDIYLLGICYCCYVIATQCFRFLLFIHSGFSLDFLFIYMYFCTNVYIINVIYFCLLELVPYSQYFIHFEAQRIHH